MNNFRAKLFIGLVGAGTLLSLLFLLLKEGKILREVVDSKRVPCAKTTFPNRLHATLQTSFVDSEERSRIDTRTHGDTWILDTCLPADCVLLIGYLFCLFLFSREFQNQLSFLLTLWSRVVERNRWSPYQFAWLEYLCSEGPLNGWNVGFSEIARGACSSSAPLPRTENQEEKQKGHDELSRRPYKEHQRQIVTPHKSIRCLLFVCVGKEYFCKALLFKPFYRKTFSAPTTTHIILWELQYSRLHSVIGCFVAGTPPPPACPRVSRVPQNLHTSSRAYGTVQNVWSAFTRNINTFDVFDIWLGASFRWETRIILWWPPPSRMFPPRELRSFWLFFRGT